MAQSSHLCKRPVEAIRRRRSAEVERYDDRVGKETPMALARIGTSGLIFTSGPSMIDTFDGFYRLR